VIGGDGATPQRVYRVVAAEPNTPSRSTVTSHHRTVAPQSFLPFPTSGSGESFPVSPDSALRVVSYQIHPVRSETDFNRSGTVYSSECHAPVNQYQGGPPGSGGWTTASEDDQYDSRFSSLLCCRVLVFQSLKNQENHCIII